MNSLPITEDPQPLRFNKHFTVANANAALVLVQKITTDITPRFAQVLKLRDEANELSQNADSNDRLLEIRDELLTLQRELNALQSELERIGCHLKDWRTGLVDFPALLDGREIWLCWHPDETEITHWHEIDTGFRDRQTITAEQIERIAQAAKSEVDE